MRFPDLRRLLGRVPSLRRPVLGGPTLHRPALHPLALRWGRARAFTGRLIGALIGNVLVRLGPAVVTATGVSLLVVGLLTYDATAGSVILPTPNPTATPTEIVSPTPLPDLSGGTPAPTSAPTGTASRIVIPAMQIDLAVVAGPSGFPYCNVAMYVPGLAQPGQPGTAYIYAHARAETFLRMLTLSEQRDNGASMIGMLVEAYTTDARVYLYEIDAVKRHVTTNGFVANPPVPGSPMDLILQTSEGNRFTTPKLQVHARYLYSQAVPPAEANPVAHAVICF